jgi:hypothetical protein
MFRPKVILQTVLFILIGSFFYSTQSDAQSKEVINPPQKRFEIGFGGGWGLYRMTNINKHYIDEFAKGIGIFDHHIDNGPTLFGEVGYFVSPNVSTNFRVTYVGGRGDQKGNINIIIMNEQGNVIDTALMKTETSMIATLVAPELKIKYHFPLEKLDLFLGGGMTWCFGKLTLKSSGSGAEGEEWQLPPYSNEYKFTAQGLGLLGSTGVSYNLNKTISFGTEMGYRLFATSGLKDKNGKVWIVDATGRPYRMNLDFSGPFILGGLRLKL